MLTIRQSQIETMLMHDEEKFIAFVMKHIQDECSEVIKDIDQNSLQQMVSNGLEQARYYHLEKPQDLTAFVTLMFDIAPNFHQQTMIQQALCDETIPIEQRFNAMIQNTPDHAWEEAERNKNNDAWYMYMQDKS